MCLSVCHLKFPPRTHRRRTLRNRCPVTGGIGRIWWAGRPAATRAAQPPNRAALWPNSGGPAQKSGRPPAKIGRPDRAARVRSGAPRWPPGRPQGGHPQNEGGPNVAAAGPMGRPRWPGGRPCGSRAAGYALDALDALVALTLRRIERIAHHCLRRLEPAGEKEGGECILRHRAPRLLITDAGEEGRVCHLGAVCVNTLYASDVDLLLGKPAPPCSSAALCNCTALLAAMAADPTATGFTSRVRRAALRA